MSLTTRFELWLPIRSRFKFSVNFDLSFDFSFQVRSQFRSRFQFSVNFDLSFDFSFQLRFQFRFQFLQSISISASSFDFTFFLTLLEVDFESSFMDLWIVSFHLEKLIILEKKIPLEIIISKNHKNYFFRESV